MEHETYTDFALTVMEAMAGPGEITQVVFSEPSEFLEAASSPITQFIYVTLRPRHDRGYELAPLVEELANGLKQVPGCYGTSWAPSDEHDNMYIGVTGWRSISVLLAPLISHQYSGTHPRNRLFSFSFSRTAITP